MVKQMKGPRSRRRAAVVGALLGFVASYLYLNLNWMERIAAETDGYPPWSWYQVPYTLPWAVLGALIAFAVVASCQRFRTRW